MSIVTWEYKVTGLKSRTEQNNEGASLPQAIVQTYWEAKGIDEHGHEGKFMGATPFTAKSVPEGEFRPFAELTEEDVLGWIVAYIDSMPGYREHIIERMTREIDEKHSELKDDILPWDPEAETMNPAAPSAHIDAEDSETPAADDPAP